MTTNAVSPSTGTLWVSSTAHPSSLGPTTSLVGQDLQIRAHPPQAPLSRAHSSPGSPSGNTGAMGVARAQEQLPRGGEAKAPIASQLIPVYRFWVPPCPATLGTFRHGWGPYLWG